MSTAVLDVRASSDLARFASVPIAEAGPATPRQQQAWQRFTALPAPKRGDEKWRFTNLKATELSPFTTATPVADGDQESVLESSLGLSEIAGRMVFANDDLLSRERLSSTLDHRGLIWLPLNQAWEEHPDLLARYFMREEAILGSQKFAALHEARVRAGTFLYVPRGVEVSLPIETWHWLHGRGGSVFPHTLIIADEMSKVTLIDRFESADATAPGFACGVNDLWLGGGAKVTYICVQNWSRETVAVQMNSTVVGRDAHAVALNLNLGGSYARTESVSHLRGSGGRSDMLSVCVADGAQEFDQRTFQIHEVPHTSSDLLYKNSLDDRARTVFSGLIRVNPGAHKTDAYQKVRNLLLSDDAEANSAPGLEIEADDVRCTHGATTGQIDEEELFYLRSRGIPKAHAQRLIVHGFLQEVIDRPGHSALADMLGQLVHRRFEVRQTAI